MLSHTHNTNQRYQGLPADIVRLRPEEWTGGWGGTAISFRNTDPGRLRPVQPEDDETAAAGQRKLRPSIDVTKDRPGAAGESVPRGGRGTHLAGPVVTHL